MGYIHGYTIQRMLSSTRIPQVWQVAILGTIASLPATIVIDWLPNSEATVGGGVMIIGALISGGIAVNRSIEPSAAGLCAGFLGGLIAVSVFVLTEGTTVAWSLNTIVFFLIAVVVILCLSPVFGLIFGRIGGWVTNTVANFGVDQAA
jgi:hypothetical protein